MEVSFRYERVHEECVGESVFVYYKLRTAYKYNKIELILFVIRKNIPEFHLWRLNGQRLALPNVNYQDVVFDPKLNWRVNKEVKDTWKRKIVSKWSLRTKMYSRTYIAVVRFTLTYDSTVWWLYRECFSIRAVWSNRTVFQDTTIYCQRRYSRF